MKKLTLILLIILMAITSAKAGGTFSGATVVGGAVWEIGAFVYLERPEEGGASISGGGGMR